VEGDSVRVGEVKAFSSGFARILHAPRARLTPGAFCRYLGFVPIELKPETEALIRQDVQRGPYRNATEFVERAVEILRGQEEWLSAMRPESIIADLKRVAQALGTDRLTAKDLDRHGRAKYHAVRSQFGTLRKGLEAAGLKTTRFCKGTDEEVIKLVQDLWVLTLRDFGRRPRTADVERYGLPIAAATIIKRFGS